MLSHGLLLALTLGLVQSVQAQETTPPVASGVRLQELLGSESVSRTELEAWLESVKGSEGPEQAKRLLREAALRRLSDGDPVAAVDLLEVALLVGPGDPRLLAPLGRAYSHLRDYLPAETVLRQAVAAGDTSGTTLVFLGDALWENGKFDEAERAYREALAKGDGSGEASGQLGRLLLWLGRYEEAAPILRRAVAQQPRAIDVLLDLADALRGAGLSDEAIGAFRRVVAASPELLRARYGLARLLAEAGEVEESKIHYDEYQRLLLDARQRALEKERREGELSRVRHLLAQGRAEEALAHLASLAESVDVLELQATALEALDRGAEAAQVLQRAVLLEPGRAELRRRLRELRRREGGR